MAGNNLVPPICGRIDNLLRHLVRKCPHFSDSVRREKAEQELKGRVEKSKKGGATQITQPLAPLQIPNIPYPSGISFQTGPAILTPLSVPPGPVSSHIHSSTLLTFETPAPTPGSSTLPTLPSVQVDDCDPGSQNKRPRLTLDITPGNGYNLALPSSNPTTPRPFFAEVLDPPKLKWSDVLQEQFRSELCMLLVATNTAWWAVDHPYVRWWVSRWVPGALVPSRKLLSGAVLDNLSKNIESEMKSKVTGKFATGQCDGWKNIAKTSLIASMINVEYVVRTFDNSVILDRLLMCTW